MAYIFDEEQDWNSANTDIYHYISRKKDGAYTNLANNSTVFDYFDDSIAVGDCFMVGRHSLATQTYYHNLTFNVGTPLVADSIEYVWEYSIGTDVWAELPNCIDKTNCFQNAGINTVYFETPLNRYKGNIVGAFYSMATRIRITAVTNATEGGANQTDMIKTRSGAIQITGTGYIYKDDLYQHDLIQTRELMCPMSATTNLSLYCQIRAMEQKMLKLSVIITDYVSTGVITLTGTDSEGNTITEDITITGNGTYATDKSYATIEDNGIDCTGDYTLQITQGRCGFVGKTEKYDYQYRQCIIVVGDGTNVIFWHNYLCNINFKDSAIIIKSYSKLGFGRLDIGKFQYSTNITFDMTYSNSRRLEYSIYSYSDAYGYYYNSSFHWFAGMSRLLLMKGEIKGCKMSYSYYLFIGSLEAIVEDVSILFASTGVYNTVSGITIKDLYVNNCSGRGMLSSGGVYALDHDDPNMVTIENIKAVDCAKVFSLYASGRAAIMLNPQTDLVSSDLEAYHNINATTYIVYLDYTMNLKVFDTHKNSIENATVILKDKNDVELFSVETDVNGDIVKQQITAKRWERIFYAPSAYTPFEDADIVEEGPFTIEIKKSGYKTYKNKFDIISKVDWTIALSKVLDSNFSKRVYINN